MGNGDSYCLSRGVHGVGARAPHPDQQKKQQGAQHEEPHRPHRLHARQQEGGDALPRTLVVGTSDPGR
eukprot:1349054-Prorocentrum_lima.AAC.1